MIIQLCSNCGDTLPSYGPCFTCKKGQYQMDQFWDKEKTLEYKIQSMTLNEIVSIVEDYLKNKDKISKVKSLVEHQAEDEGLWFKAQYATESYLQTALRELHKVIEDIF